MGIILAKLQPEILAFSMESVKPMLSGIGFVRLSKNLSLRARVYFVKEGFTPFAKYT